MQCPTCGSTTAGTLDRCANCGTPTGAAAARNPGGPGPAPGDADGGFGDRTMVVPNPGALSAGPGGGQPPGGPGTPGTPPSGFGGGQPGMPLSAPPALAPSAGDVPPPPAPSWASSEAAAAGDPESTAGWVFDPAESGEHKSSAPADPHPSDMKTIIAPMSAPAAPAATAQNWQDGAAEQPSESIVPESWYAKPRRPGEPAEPAGPQQWQPQPQATMADQGWGQQQPPAAGFQQDAGEQATAMIDPGAAGSAPGGPGGFGQPQGFGQDAGFGQQGNFGQDAGFGQQGGFGQQDAGFGQQGGFGQGNFGQQQGFDQGGFDQGGYGGQQGFQGGPPPGGGSGGGKKPSKPLLIGVGALVAAAVVAVTVVLWPSGDKGGTDPNSSKSPVAQKSKIPVDDATKQQAEALNSILNASADTKRTLVRGLAQSRKCQDLPGAVNSFKEVAQRRGNQLKRTQGLKVDKLEHGEKLRASLHNSLQASLDVDTALLNWANQSQKGCKGKPKPDAGHAPGRADAERRATSSKKGFVDLWNPVARKTGQPARTWTGV